MRPLILAGVLTLIAGATAAQPPSTAPRFQVASVRVAPVLDVLPEGYAANPRIAGGRFSWTTDLSSLVRYAYRVPTWRLSGIVAPGMFYRIDASTDPPANQEDVRSMLRQLLVDRFKLTTHTRVEQRAGYALVVADRPKLQRLAASGSVPPMPDYLKRQSAAAFEGAIFVSMEGIGTAAMTGRGVTLARVAETLSGQLKEFVIDETGMTGNYYFGFTFRNLDSPDGAVESAPLPDALREQLGLRLERRKGPVEFLVVDHVERIPSEN
jgi:uncharacterized protein (TIGR03435 family)